MEWVLGGAALVGFLWWRGTRKAHGIARRHAATMSAATGIPAERIYREMIAAKLTPGEWAARHGLDPVTFSPSRMTPEQAEQALERTWAPMRLDPAASAPDGETLQAIADLQGEFARLAATRPDAATAARQAQVLVALHRLGCRVDADWVNDAVRRARRSHLPARRPYTQAEYDNWQAQEVERRRALGDV